jgi:hypothetical protein
MKEAKPPRKNINLYGMPVWAVEALDREAVKLGRSRLNHMRLVLIDRAQRFVDREKNAADKGA